MDGGQKAENGQEQAAWVFKPGDTPVDQKVTTPPPAQPAQQPPSPANEENYVEWTGSEFIAHHKGFSWYAILFLGAFALAGLIYLLTKDFVAAGVVVFAALVLAVAGAHKPRMLAYRLDNAGLTIGQKSYPYANFKSFAVIDEGPFASIIFIPLKRFMPPVNIYFPPESAQDIMDVLSVKLPIEQRPPGMVDTAVRRIRF
jgi:hypothetical protein